MVGVGIFYAIGIIIFLLSTVGVYLRLSGIQAALEDIADILEQKADKNENP